jgi:hypothetical protein
MRGQNLRERKVRELTGQIVKLANDLALAAPDDVEDRALRLAVATFQAAVLVSNVAFECTLTSPPDDVAIRVNASGTLVYRCFHDPAHEWDLNGNQRQ